MTVERFCGNGQNHDAHDYVSVIFGVERDFHCDGVFIEREPERVEKFDPKTEAMDGTTYLKVRIFIENPKTGETTIISADRVSREMFEVEHQKYVSLERTSGIFPPQIERAIFSFTPNRFGEDPAFTITREMTHGE